MRGVRVRFCPSPTGNPHVGLVRTALFNWAFARHHGGVFVFRIEDTDASRDTEQSYLALLDALRWLGLDWDEGPEVGGPYPPYRQSQRLGVYADVAGRLSAAGRAYECFCTADEISERARVAGRSTPGYDNHCRELGQADRDRLRAEGRASVLRLRMPDREIGFDDLVRGRVTFAPEHVPDYVLVRANGRPLYTLVNPVDDALMHITHVLRGEDLLSSTPRQIALYDALAEIGVGEGGTPAFGHLPYVTGEGNKKLSKRDPESALNFYREQGYLPEGIVNYLALLGWSMGEDRESFTLAEMAAAFDLARVSRNPARFDVKKLTAINGDKIRALPAEELAHRLLPFLQAAGLVADPPAAPELSLLGAAVPLVQTRMDRLVQGVDLLRFLFIDEEAFAVEPAAAAKVLTPAAAAVLEAALAAAQAAPQWSTQVLQQAIDAAVIEQLGLSKRAGYAPLRVAVTGSTVAPPLFESMQLLGRERVVARLRAGLTLARQS